jgi:hypothetical protein
MREPRKRLEQAKTVATDCDQLPIGAHGKEGVDASSPSEGFSREAIPGDRNFVAPCSTTEHLHTRLRAGCGGPAIAWGDRSWGRFQVVQKMLMPIVATRRDVDRAS